MLQITGQWCRLFKFYNALVGSGASVIMCIDIVSTCQIINIVREDIDSA